MPALHTTALRRLRRFARWTSAQNARRNVLRLRDEAGQSLVEFAVTLPVLLMVVTGLCTFGIAINNYMQLTEATNVGARQLAISRGQTTDPCSTASTAMMNAAPLLKTSSLTFKWNFNGNTYTGTSCNSASTSTGAAGNLVEGTTASMTVTYPCSLKIYSTTLVSSCVLTAQTAELVQ